MKKILCILTAIVSQAVFPQDADTKQQKQQAVLSWQSLIIFNEMFLTKSITGTYHITSDSVYAKLLIS